MPGCTIAWAFDTKVGNTNNGLLVAASGSRWIGGTFRNLPQVSPSPPANPTYSLYNFGSVLRLIGDDLLIEDVTIDGYNGIAMIVQGDRVRIVNPTIRKPQLAVPANTFPNQPDPVVPNGAGIRVYQGTGFRCYGGGIDSGGDAALQFSGDRTVPGDISDGLYQGVHCTSIQGGTLRQSISLTVH